MSMMLSLMQRMASVFVLAIACGGAAAAPITIAFSGAIDFADAAVASGFAAGQALTGSYTFESTTTARLGSTSSFAVFDALTNLSVSSGGFTASSSGAPEIQLDNAPGAPNDRYAVVARASDGLAGTSVSGFSIDAFAFRLDDLTNTVFSDALILPTTLSLAPFSSNGFFLFFRNTAGDLALVSGRLDALATVPEPGTTALIALALVLTGVFLRGRARSF